MKMDNFIKKLCEFIAPIIVFFLSLMLFWIVITRGWWLVVGQDNLNVLDERLSLVGMSCGDFKCSIRGTIAGGYVVIDKDGDRLYMDHIPTYLIDMQRQR